MTWCGEPGGGKGHLRVCLGGAQIAPPKCEPAADRQTYGKAAPVPGRPRLRDRSVEQGPHLHIPLGEEQRKSSPRKS
jgi:hypothetical protein